MASMLTVDIPGWRSLQLEVLLLDVNGTLTLDGELLAGVDAGLKAFIQLGMLDVQLVSADTFGRLDNIAAQLGARAKRLESGRPEAAQKADVVTQLGGERVVAIGNGANDADMLGEAALGIAVFGPEGLAASALAAADVVVASIDDALGLLRNPKRLIATLRR
jgi:soluble P-type ATPase